MKLPMHDGTIKTVEVTEKWLARMEAQGKICNVSDSAVLVHAIEKLPSFSGDERFVEGERHWIIGQDIGQSDYAKLKDENGDLYAFVIHEGDGARTVCVDKRMWLKSRDKRIW